MNLLTKTNFTKEENVYTMEIEEYLYMCVFVLGLLISHIRIYYGWLID